MCIQSKSLLPEYISKQQQLTEMTRLTQKRVKNASSLNDKMSGKNVRFTVC